MIFFFFSVLSFFFLFRTTEPTATKIEEESVWGSTEIFYNFFELTCAP